MNKYGLYGKLQAMKGKGEELAAVMLEAAALMETAKGCILYMVGKEIDYPDIIRVMEVWDSKEDHEASLNIPGVRTLIMKAMPLLEEDPQMGMALDVLGGKGLAA
jgi:quinol monooxygenase YgiN